MKIVITGGAGFLGSRLTRALLATSGAARGLPRFDGILSVDLAPSPVGDARVTSAVGDIADPAFAGRVIGADTVGVFHLAAVLSGQSEAEFDLGMRVNLDGTRALLEAARATGAAPRFVFASSVAVFGGALPAVMPETMAVMPASSYGTQKAIGELLLSDYTRRGFFDGIGLRLPTICIRPGQPNKAASGFFSNILREPIAGQEAVLPVPDDVRHYFASPRAAIGFFLHAATMDLSAVGPRRNLSLPGLSATVGDEIAALGRIVGEKAVKLIRREPDPTIIRIVSGWATDIEGRRARELGFVAESSFDEIIQAHLEDEMGGSAKV